METPYIITEQMWIDYYTVQMSGRMNMMGHPLVIYFMGSNAYSQALEHFQVNKNKSDLVIE